MVKSVFREEGWRSQRHLLNPSKFKEYELHASGLGFLNSINIIKDFYERFTPMDTIDEESLAALHKHTTLHIIRKEISDEEKGLLERDGFRLIKTWGTLILDTEKFSAIGNQVDLKLNLDSNTNKNIRKGESRLDFFQVKTDDELKEYYELFKQSRKELNFKTASFNAYKDVFKNRHYIIFGARDKDTKKLVAGLGTIQNENYLMEVNAARDSTCFFANDYLKWKIIEYCRNNNIRYYDFAGCNPSPEQGSKDFNLRKFKEKWGGEFNYEYTFKR